MHIVLFGAPGAGKGTQAKILSEIKNIPHISTGDLLREQVNLKTKIGVEIEDTLNQGGFATDEIMSVLIREKIIKDPNAFILDGFPRNLAQIKYLDSILDELKINNLKYFYLKVDSSIILERLNNRLNCSNCNLIINNLNNQEELVCPKCGFINSFKKRNDDKIEIIKRRLEIFFETTLPVIDHYFNKRNLITLDGSLTTFEITKKILSFI